MKRLLGLTLVLAMLLPCAAMAEEPAAAAAVTANAVVESANTYDVTAPFSGVLKSFDWERGDRVKAEDVLFTIDTVKVYSPADGTVQAIFVEPGDLCEDAALQYGMIACVEKDPPQVVKANTTGAYNDAENKLIHVGETVYFQQTNDKDNEGEGRVVSVSASEYSVEVTAGDFDIGDSVKIYRDEKMGTKTCIGQGGIERAADIGVTASGRVLSCAVEEGQKVKRGQLLFELAPADAEPSVKDARVPAGHDGALDGIQAAAGLQVYKGQTLATIHDLTALNVVAEVDEMDLDRIAVGDSLAVVFDRYPEVEVSGTVRSISRIGTQKQNATYYDVEIAFSTSVEVLPGMSATVWLPAKP